MPSAALPASCFKAWNLFREEEKWEKAWKIWLNHTKPHEGNKKKYICQAQAKPVAHSIISWRCSLGTISPIVTVPSSNTNPLTQLKKKKNLSKSYLYFPTVVLYIQTLSHCVVVKIRPLILDGKGKSLIWFHRVHSVVAPVLLILVILLQVLHYSLSFLYKKNGEGGSKKKKKDIVCSSWKMGAPSF